MKTDNKPIIVIEESCPTGFENKCRELIEKGYDLSSSNCGFVQSEAYDFCSVYQAIFIDNENKNNRR